MIRADIIEKLDVNDTIIYCNSLEAEEEKEKNVVVFAHTLSAGGSQKALTSLLPRLYGGGYNIYVISPEDGYFADIFVAEYDAVVAITGYNSDAGYKEFLIEAFDLAVINSVCSDFYLDYFRDEDIPVLYWVHESKETFINLEKHGKLKVSKSDNIHYYSAWPGPGRDFKEVFDLDIGMLPIETIDKYDGEEGNKDNSLIQFLIPGSYSYRKGFHHAIDAINKLPPKVFAKAEFIFCGYIADPVYYEMFDKLRDKVANIKILGEISLNEMDDYYASCDSVIVPSVFDAGPLTAIEALMHHKICIISDKTGASEYLHDCIDGFVYPCEDTDELMKRIMLTIEEYQGIRSIADKGRMVYEDNFSSDVIDRCVDDILKAIN